MLICVNTEEKYTDYQKVKQDKKKKLFECKIVSLFSYNQLEYMGVRGINNKSRMLTLEDGWQYLQ